MFSNKPLTENEKKALKHIESNGWGEIHPDDFDFNKFSRKTYNSLVKKGYLNLYGSVYCLTEKEY
jgi:hypothetical protein